MATYNYTKNYAQLREDLLVSECVAAPNSLPVTDVQRVGDGTINVITSVALSSPQQTTLASAVAAHNGLPRGTPVGDNLIINGGSTFFQRSGVYSQYDAQYGLDRWCHLGQGSGALNLVSVSQLSPGGGRWTQIWTSSNRFGVAQIIDGNTVIGYRGNQLTLSALVRSNPAFTVRYAILEWPGTFNAPSRDPVNDWTNGTFSPGNFFISTISVLAQDSVAATNLSQAVALTCTVSNAANNLYVIFWTDGLAPVNGFIELDQVGLYPGAAVRDWTPRAYTVEELLCRRYCLKLATQDLGMAQQASRVYQGGVMFPISMLKAPTLVSGSFGVNAGSAGAVQLQNSSPTGVAFVNSTGNWTVGALVSVSCVIEGEF